MIVVDVCEDGRVAVLLLPSALLRGEPVRFSNSTFFAKSVAPKKKRYSSTERCCTTQRVSLPSAELHVRVQIQIKHKVRDSLSIAGGSLARTRSMQFRFVFEPRGDVVRSLRGGRRRSVHLEFRRDEGACGRVSSPCAFTTSTSATSVVWKVDRASPIGEPVNPNWQRGRRENAPAPTCSVSPR